MDDRANIVLVGFMGTGKSAVARELARRLGWQALDTDALIEERAGRGVGEIFDTEGEAWFRDLETRLLRELLEEGARHRVVATGGGIVLGEENWPLLRGLGPVVALMASAETICERTQGAAPRRPLLEVADRRAEILRRLRERAPFYARAEGQVRTDGKSPAEVAADVLGLLGLQKD